MVYSSLISEQYFIAVNQSPMYMPRENNELKTELLLGDSEEILAEFQDSCIDLIMPSPPYADQRVSTYGGHKPDEDVAWVLPIAKEMLRVLKPAGTFILNIKEKATGGERHTYILELILEMRKQGWLWTEEFIWHKKNCYPGKWPNRFRDAWERCLQFNREKKFSMYQEAVMVPTGDWAKSRLKNLSETDKIRDNSKVGSGFGKNVSKWLGREWAYPTNVLHLATECSNKGHSSAYPKELPAWFIKLFTQEGDWILDPFVGSRTTCVAAREIGRDSIEIELKEKYYNLAKVNIEEADTFPRQPRPA